jgi:adenosylcobinamide-GDP ribazoletransferase
MRHGELRIGRREHGDVSARSDSTQDLGREIATPSSGRRELELFFTALAFFTRVPIPAWVPYSDERLNRSARYFPLVGLVVGGTVAAGYLAFAAILPVTVAVVLSMALSVRLTGAFHEDGFADACDGLGAGFTTERVLEIMKDSRLGTYGVAGLTLMLGAKACALVALGAEGPARVAVALLVAHPLSRLAATTLNQRLPYVRADADAKAKPIARGLRRVELLIASAFGLAPLALLPRWEAGLALLATVLVAMHAERLFRRRLGGFTGDLLGAAQQGTELSIYLAMLASGPLAAAITAW